ncbi:MAG: hypothetical protein OXC26_08965 [Albidovulum sp.]|nr:hypothetical protein [Albidovulum sp.]
MDLFCHPANGFLAGFIGSPKLNVFESGNVIAAALETPGMPPGIIAAIRIRAKHLSPAGGDSEPVFGTLRPVEEFGGVGAVPEARKGLGVRAGRQLVSASRGC